MTSPNLSEIVTTTARRRSAKLADNVSDQTALLQRIKEKGNQRPFNGGRTIVEELMYAENVTYTRYAGYETLNITPSDSLTAAEFDIKQAAVAITISGLEELQNAGDAEIINLLEARIKVAEITMMNNLSADIYSNGTASGGKQIGGLQALVSDAGTGTVGGINSSTYTWWQNQKFDFSDNSLTPGAATIQTAMNRLYLACSRGRDVPDLIVADDTYFRYYWESLQAIQRIASDSSAQAGFQKLKFMGADVVFDGGQGGDAPASHMYFLNTNYIHFRPHSARNMSVIGGDRFSTNQDAMVRLIGWAGNMTISNRALQGVIVA